MIIISQDRKQARVFKKIKLSHAWIVEPITETGIILGIYETPERAAEVFEDIIKHNGLGAINYYMPKE